MKIYPKSSEKRQSVDNPLPDQYHNEIHTFLIKYFQFIIDDTFTAQFWRLFSLTMLTAVRSIDTL